MPLPVVTVELVAVADEPPGARATLIDACNEAFARGGCELTSAGDPQKHALARVWFEIGSAAARVELRGPSRAPPLHRTLRFRESDSALERWRAVGFVVGSLADEATPAAAPAVAVPARTDRPRAETAPASPPSPRRVWLDLSALAGPVLSDWRWGAALRSSYAPDGSWFATLAVRYAVVPRDARGLELTFVSPSAGVGHLVSFEAADLRLGARLEAHAELAQASAESGGRSDAARRWSAGARAGADLAWVPGWVGLSLGGDVSYAPGPLDIRLHSRPAGSLNPLTFSMLAGVRAELP